MQTIGGKVHENLGFFHSHNDDNNNNACQHQYMVVIIFILEHLVILALTALRKFVDDKPQWVQVFRKRDEYLHRAAF